MTTVDKELQEFINNCHKLQPKASKNNIKIETSINEHGALVGDVLCEVWGYDQTNYDFYKVIKVTKQTVTLEKINGYDAGKIYKNKKTKCYRNDGSEYCVSMTSYSYATCSIKDRYAKRNHELAIEAANDPYNMH